ncbi:MAG TPA: lasso peptide biosynthesis B2 protein [Symbiobacteriaceae bacterium]|nr:lasso peptide biosynthesis B2 protein [Symbiobacteriaceae bacterium]
MRDWAPLLWVEALGRLVLLERRLRREPFTRVVARLQPARQDQSASEPNLRIVTVVQRCATWMPFKAECLQIALVTYQMLARRGMPVTFHLGAQKSPFAAHAWVSCRGRVLTDRPEVAQLYPELLRV